MRWDACRHTPGRGGRRAYAGRAALAGWLAALLDVEGVVSDGRGEGGAQTESI